MASPRTRRVLKEIKPKDGNSVSRIEMDNTKCYFLSLLHENCDLSCVCDRLLELLRMWGSQSTVGERDLWNMDLSRMFRQASWIRSSFKVQ